jgi:hypothetical protein
MAGTPEQFHEYWMEDLRNWTAIVRETGVTVE